ncbi:MAG TPA: potassium channel family protein [Candidatus Dormibacteraeota bacterium]|nr:potassium channel family protein [Candidatus Dormibacteraeota bacterium]
MDFVRWLEVVTGVVIILVTFYDIFKSVVLPRPAINKFVLIRRLFFALWNFWLWANERQAPNRREGWLATFGPVAVLFMFGTWAVILMFGYAFVIDGVHDEIRPMPGDFWESLYFSATTIVPLSYGDLVPVGLGARLAVIFESASGVGIAALVITLLFSLYEAFQRREELVVTLDALAGAPPSGVQLLETAAERNMPERLNITFDEWRAWMAAVLESHLAYPVLFYFRSSHDNEAWLNSFGAVMDAAALVLSSVTTPAEGSAKLTLTIGNHLVEDMVWYFGFARLDDVGVERVEFDQALERLAKVGYKVHDGDQAWEHFSKIRSRYAFGLNAMAHRFAIIPAQWIGDRSYMPHRSGRARVRPR